MSKFSNFCQELGIHVASEKTKKKKKKKKKKAKKNKKKTKKNVTCLIYLGYQRDTIKMQMRILSEKVLQILRKIEKALSLI